MWRIPFFMGSCSSDMRQPCTAITALCGSSPRLLYATTHSGFFSCERWMNGSELHLDKTRWGVSAAIIEVLISVRAILDMAAPNQESHPVATDESQGQPTTTGKCWLDNDWSGKPRSCVAQREARFAGVWIWSGSAPAILGLALARWVSCYKEALWNKSSLFVQITVDKCFLDKSNLEIRTDPFTLAGHTWFVSKTVGTQVSCFFVC